MRLGVFLPAKGAACASRANDLCSAALGWRSRRSCVRQGVLQGSEGKERAEMQCIRVLMALSLAMGVPGCRDEVESSTYPIGQTGETCTAYKGFERQPPEVVVAELAKRGLDSSRLVHRTVCGPITSWDILPAGASIDRIPPPKP